VLRGKYKQSGKHVIAVGTAMLTTGSIGTERLLLIVYTGDNDRNLLWFDLNEQTEFTSLTETGRFVARKTHVLIDPVQRTLLIEAGRGRTSAEELADFIEENSRTIAGFETLELSFAPVPSSAFAKRIDGMQRIQMATVTIARPNVDWGDRYNQLTKTAEDSNAKVIETSVRAGRNESLSKDAGLVSSIRHWATDTMSSLVNAKIKGTFGSGSTLTELKLSDHVETVNLSFELDAKTKQPSNSEIQKGLNSILDAKALPGENNG